MIQIGHTRLLSNAQEVDRLRAEFNAVRCIQLPHLLEPSLLAFVEHRIEQARWQGRVHPGVGSEYVMEDLPALNLLHFISNLPDFRNLIEEITGRGPLRRFQGRIYRMTATEGHHDDWHDDNVHCRLVGVSLNLSSRVFRGGLFQLRERKSKRMLAEIANTGGGSALIFSIAEELQPRISDMEGEEPKTAFAGWFRSDLSELLKELRGNTVTEGSST